MAITADGAWLVAGDSAGVITLWDLGKNTPQTVLFDPTANDANTKGLTDNSRDTITGRTITYTLPCGSPIPPGAVCTCNCVPGTISVARPTTPTYRPGRTICTCNKICTCVPISSARWKTDIRAIDSPLELTTRLRGVRYRWTEDAPEGQTGADIGLVAEEVLQVLPESLVCRRHS